MYVIRVDKILAIILNSGRFVFFNFQNELLQRKLMGIYLDYLVNVNFHYIQKVWDAPLILSRELCMVSHHSVGKKGPFMPAHTLFPTPSFPPPNAYWAPALWSGWTGHSPGDGWSPTAHGHPPCGSCLAYMSLPSAQLSPWQPGTCHVKPGVGLLGQHLGKASGICGLFPRKHPLLGALCSGVLAASGTWEQAQLCFRCSFPEMEKKLVAEKCASWEQLEKLALNIQNQTHHHNHCHQSLPPATQQPNSCTWEHQRATEAAGA